MTALVGCLPEPVAVGDGDDAAGTTTDGDDGEDTSGADATDGETSSGDIEPEGDDSTDEPEPDLPEGCLPLAEATRFAEVCFAAPIALADDGVELLARLPFDGGTRYFAAGPDKALAFTAAQLAPGGSSQVVPIEGRAIATAPVTTVMMLDVTTRHVVATHGPDQLWILDLVGDVIQIVDEFPLEAEPVSMAALDGVVDEASAVAVVDVNGNLTLFEVPPGGAVSSLGQRALAATLVDLHGPDDWGSPLVGVELDGGTAWQLEPPVLVGATASWTLADLVTHLELRSYDDVSPSGVLVATADPHRLRLYPNFGSEVPEAEIGLGRPLFDLDAGDTPYATGELYGLAHDPAALTAIGDRQPDLTLFEPERWLAVPEATVDFLALGDARFLLADPVMGLWLLEPEG